jgi:hypothetical protein
VGVVDDGEPRFLRVVWSGRCAAGRRGRRGRRCGWLRHGDGRRPAAHAIVAGTTIVGWTALSIGVGAFTDDLVSKSVPTEELIALGGMAILPVIAAGIWVASAAPQHRVVVRPAQTPELGPGWAVAGTF